MLVKEAVNMKKNTPNTLTLRMVAERLSEWLHKTVERMAELMDESGWHPGMRYHTPRTDP